MLTFPCCKINLGLNIVETRPDGYHNIETVFYPVPLTDALEIKKMHEDFPSDTPCHLQVTFPKDSCDKALQQQLAELPDDHNLVVRAYQLLAKDYRLPRIYAHLCKRIPSQAGLGGGSSDAAFMIRLLDERFGSTWVLPRWSAMQHNWVPTVPSSSQPNQSSLRA